MSLFDYDDEDRNVDKNDCDNMTQENGDQEMDINSIVFTGRPESQPEIVRCILNNLLAIMPFIMESVRPLIDMRIANK